MYHQAWPWGGTASASPTSGFVQPTASTPVATTQWPAGYSQYAVTPELQQQWAAAWASQAQYAYSSNVPVGTDPQTTAAFTGAYPDYQTAAGTVTTSETKKADDANSSTEKPKNSAEQPLSQDLAESDKIKQLKEQAEKWTSLQQPAVSSWSSTAAPNTVSSNGNTTTVTAPNDSSKTLTSTNVTQSDVTQSQMSKEEEEFERQFKEWEKQFEAWKQQNQNHPDKEAFAQYEKQWQEWRAQLLQKKEQMQKAKAEQMAGGVSLQSSTSGSVAGFVNTQTNSTNITDAAASTSTTAMYYQHPQYMYMQPYMYPGATTVAPATAVPPAVVQSAVVPPAVIPSTMVPPTGVPPVSMPPAVMPSAVSQQMQYNMHPGLPDSYGNQGPMGMSGPQHSENMNYDSQGAQDYENERDMYNYGLMRGNRDDGMGPNFEGFDPNMIMPEGDFQRDNWKFGRGRGRGGRGRVRGRGRDRWSEPADMDVRSGPGGSRNQRKTLLPGGPGTFPEDDGPPPFEYPPEDCRDEFVKEDGSFPDDRQHPGDRFAFCDGPQQFHPDDAFPPQPFDEHYPPDPNQYPPDQDFPDRFPPEHERFPPDQRFPPDRKRFPPDLDRFPPDHERFPPDQERFPPGLEGFPRGQDRFPPDHERFPPGEERFSRNSRFNPDNEIFPSDQERFALDQERFLPDQECFPPDPERFPPGQERFPPGDDRFPPEEGRFPPGPERFPSSRHMMDEGGFGDRDFNQFPPEDEMYGPPPFRDDFPPFDDRGARGRGRFAGRGRRFRGEFDRFGPPFPPRMRNEFPADFPPQPDDRFGFPVDGPPRMPPPRGMRSSFEPAPFGPEGRFPDEPPFFDDGPQRYKSIDYTHRPAAAVMGDEFNPHYEFESEFQDDVNAYRARPPKRKKKDAQRKSTVEKKRDKDKDKDKDKNKDKDEDIAKDKAKDD